MRGSLRSLWTVLAAALPATAGAGSFDLFDTISGEYRLTLNYGVAVRMEDPHQNLINGPVDPLMPIPPGPDNPFPQFHRTGLPETINFDDGNRSFEKYSLINNRFTSFGELNLTWGSFGLVGSGVAHYDDVFFHGNENDSPDTINKFDFQNHDRFTEPAQDVNGARARMLDGYVFWNDGFGPVGFDFRLGYHLAAWGESLFFPGIVSAMGPNDATKAFVPGAEVKEILLPVKQASLRLGLGSDFSVLGYYQFEFQPTEIFPVGDFFSPADVVGPGAQFVHASANPAYGESCPGLFDLDGPGGTDFSFLCALPMGLGGPVLNAEPTIKTYRRADIYPSDSGQWGTGATWQITPNTNVGAYYIKYHNHNPSVQLNVGFAEFGYVENPLTGDRIVLSTEANQQYVPVTYNIVYADDITMYALSWSSVLFGVNFAGEFIRRENLDMPVEATISGVVAPVGSRGTADSAQVSFLYTTNPDFLFYDEIPLVGEFSYMRVAEIDPGTPTQGIEYSGNGDVLFYDKEAWAFQILTLPKGRNVFNGWDLGTPIQFQWLVEGTPSASGQFGALFGEGDIRASAGLSLQYVQNLEFTLMYNWFGGDPYKTIGRSTLRANPYVDHDYATFNVKYNL